MQSNDLEIDTPVDKMKQEKEPIQNIIPFWSDNPNILLNNEFLFEFFPVENMAFEQKLNAISRTIVLLSLMTFFYTKSFRILLIGAISLFFIFMLHKSMKPKEPEGFDITTPAKQLYTTTDVMNVFREPDSSNPFGNVLITDYVDKEFVRKANPDQPDITDKLFKDLGDEYVFEQSLRPFTSTASTTIPNDQQSFSEFCYGSMVSCKEGNAFACAKNVARYNNY